MSERVVELDSDLEAQLAAHVEEWIEVGLRTGPADRPAFEEAVRRCYEYAQISWHGNVVWVDSPLVLHWAGGIAERLIHFNQPVTGDPRYDVMEEMLAAVDHVVSRAWSTGFLPRLLWKAEAEVCGALDGFQRDGQINVGRTYDDFASCVRSQGLEAFDEFGRLCREQVHLPVARNHGGTEGFVHDSFHPSYHSKNIIL